MNIISLIQSIPDYIGGSGVLKTDIEDCEKELDVVFATDYKQYLEEIGLACFDGKELTGICNSERLNVVNVTYEERSKKPTISKSWYVIEQTNFDGIVVWQDNTGKVYQLGQNCKIQHIYDSLYDYIEKCR